MWDLHPILWPLNKWWTCSFFSNKMGFSDTPLSDQTTCSGQITWWLIPLSKWVITPVINGISRVNPLKKLGWTNPLTIRGMSHQVLLSTHLNFLVGVVQRCPNDIPHDIPWYHHFCSGWWLTYPSEKYMSRLGLFFHILWIYYGK